MLYPWAGPQERVFRTSTSSVPCRRSRGWSAGMRFPIECLWEDGGPPIGCQWVGAAHGAAPWAAPWAALALPENVDPALPHSTSYCGLAAARRKYQSLFGQEILYERGPGSGRYAQGRLRFDVG